LEGTGSSCQPGTNQVIVSGYPDGAYKLRLSATSAGKTRAREELIVAGTPVATEIEGALSITDDSDADYPGTYYIDYYEVTDAEAGVLSLIDVSSSFSVQLGLYDADQRSAADGGGVVRIVSGGDSVSMDFIPEAGKRYLVGVSSQGSQATGSYTLRLQNNGTPTPASLE
jgi:hypothetical protein